jgi:hypothetical protein
MPVPPSGRQYEIGHGSHRATVVEVGALRVFTRSMARTCCTRMT